MLSFYLRFGLNCVIVHPTFIVPYWAKLQNQLTATAS